MIKRPTDTKLAKQCIKTVMQRVHGRPTMACREGQLMVYFGADDSDRRQRANGNDRIQTVIEYMAVGKT